MKLSKFVVIGNPINRSLSPNIYNHLFGAFNINSYYSRLLLDDFEHSQKIVRLLDISGVNVTMPHKQSAFSLGEIHDYYSLETEASNTLIFSDKIYAYNTDFIGFEFAIATHEIDFSGKSILLIGAGNTAGTVLRALDKCDCKIDIINRNFMNVNILKNSFNKISVVDESTISDKYYAVISCVPSTEFIGKKLSEISAEVFIEFDYIHGSSKKEYSQYNKYIGGRELLIYQAFMTYKHFRNHLKGFGLIRDVDVFYSEVYQLLKEKRYKKNNISFTGYMGTGKSSLARLIAQKFEMNYVSIDDCIEKKYNMSINDIFTNLGENTFRAYEEEMLKSLENVENSIIDCGGGICEYPNNRDMLKNISFNIFMLSDLQQSWERIKGNSNLPIIANMQFEDYEKLYFERLDNYFITSDMIIYNQYNINKLADLLVKEIRSILC